MRYRRFRKNNSNLILYLSAILILIYLLKNPEIIVMGVLSVIIIGFLYITVTDLLKNQKYKNCPLETIDAMTGTEFEKYLVVKYKEKGYKVQHMGRSGDYGADLILEKYNEKIIVQAKRYNGTVGVKAVQQAISAREYYKCSKAMVVTNSFFTPNAKTMASTCNVVLIDRNKLP